MIVRRLVDAWLIIARGLCNDCKVASKPPKALGAHARGVPVGQWPAAFSRITATVVADDAALDRCVKALEKLINVITVQDFSREEVEHVARELILCKVKCNTKTRTEIIEIASLFRAKVVDVAHDTVVIEFTGNENKIGAFLDLISPYGILATARTGAVALPRGLKKAVK